MKRLDRLKIPMTIEWDSNAKRKDILRHLIETNDFQTMVEVGVDTGKTTFYLLDNIPNLKIYAVDIGIKKFYNKEVAAKYGDRLIPIEGYSYIVADQIQDNTVDIVFIDGDHSYEGVKKDIHAYRPKLKSTGLLTGHDIDYPGVNKAVTEFIKEFDVGPNFVWIEKIRNI